MSQKQKLIIQEYELPITVEQDTSGGFVARCQNWHDCYAQGDTIEEAINEISYVASSLIELYKEEGMEIPLMLKRSEKKNPQSLKFTFPIVVSGN